jgi:hypothetical protein
MPRPRGAKTKAKVRSAAAAVVAGDESGGAAEPAPYLPREFDPAFQEQPEEDDATSEVDDDSVFRLSSDLAAATLSEQVDSYQPGGWLKLRQEKQWAGVTGELPDVCGCTVDVEALAESALAIPFNVRFPVIEELASVADKHMWLEVAARHGKRPRNLPDFEVDLCSLNVKGELTCYFGNSYWNLGADWSLLLFLYVCNLAEDSIIDWLCFVD